MARKKDMARVCTKTKICMFYLSGTCSKGKACSFAHHESELQPLPDFSRTKMCPVLVANGRCQDSECCYAHNEPELRQDPRKGRRVVEAKELAPMALPMPVKPGAIPSSQWTRPMTPTTNASTSSSEHWAICSHGTSMEDIQFTPDSNSTVELDDMSVGFSRQTTQETYLVAPPPLAGACRTPSKSSEASRKQELGQTRTRNKFFRTKMCSFQVMGKCRKKGACSFAHTAEEMNPLPDLRRTKLCPIFTTMGVCKDSLCPFAHDKDELRIQESKVCEDTWSNTLHAPIFGSHSIVSSAESFTSEVDSSSTAPEEDDSRSVAPEDDSSSRSAQFPLPVGPRRSRVSAEALQTPDPQLRLMVKNTFLSLEPAEGLRFRMIRSRSEPLLMRPEGEAGCP
mmetsp:Transcript_65251/g.147211  ORF Transcript_65251/g.147211 Transcript_65251/m.147211 type:complete len:396 (-) Transcript_65251:66-1253(-)